MTLVALASIDNANAFLCSVNIQTAESRGQQGPQRLIVHDCVSQINVVYSGAGGVLTVQRGSESGEGRETGRTYGK